MPYLTYIVLAISLLAAIGLAVGSTSIAGALPMVGILLVSLVYLAVKSELSRKQTEELQRMRNAYDQLDRQAKLIIRTDLELHRTQEELDRRLASLMSLYHLGQQLQVSLRPEEMFQKLEPSVITNFGFSKGMLGICASFETLEWRSVVGVTPQLADAAHRLFVDGGLVKPILSNPAPRLLQASSAANPAEQRLLELLGVPTAVVAGVIPNSGPAGLLLLGRTGSVANVKADEELVAILTNYLAIAIENSALYEKTWSAQRELELKVQQRTQELAEANAVLMRLNKAKSDFVSAVSHELRTPLAAIKGYASLLATGQFGSLAKAQQERVAKIEKHSDLLTQFINNLLDIARIESGRVTMERKPIPIEEFLTAVQDVVSPQMETKRIRFSVDRDGVTQLVGDTAHLQRVFVNLLSNAIKYTPEGGAIRVGLAREGSSVLATVSDTGCGIAAEDQAKLFQEFHRANDPVNQQVRGTGLGLALVKRIVEAHQGRIWVESEKGKGSTFSVSLPVD
jgi:signal transduction histidine kinase